MGGAVSFLVANGEGAYSRRLKNTTTAISIHQVQMNIRRISFLKCVMPSFMVQCQLCSPSFYSAYGSI